MIVCNFCASKDIVFHEELIEDKVLGQNNISIKYNELYCSCNTCNNEFATDEQSTRNLERRRKATEEALEKENGYV